MKKVARNGQIGLGWLTWFWSFWRFIAFLSGILRSGSSVIHPSNKGSTQFGVSQFGLRSISHEGMTFSRLLSVNVNIECERCHDHDSTCLYISHNYSRCTHSKPAILETSARRQPQHSSYQGNISRYLSMATVGSLAGYGPGSFSRMAWNIQVIVRGSIAYM